MITPQGNAFARAAAIAERDKLHPFSCMRQDTGDLVWLVQSRSDPSRYYLLTVSGENVHCACPQAEHHGICAHSAAVHLALQKELQQRISSACPQHIQPPVPKAQCQDHRSESQREQERQRQAEAERREQALLWADDRPFSIWKS